MNPIAGLTPADWPAISALLDEVLALAPSERNTFVEQLDGGRAQYRDTLRQLLSQAAGVETGDFLATLPRLSAAGPAAADPLAEPAAGATVGPYRLLSELGAGGMGTVWLAERADGTLKRKVALKLPRLAWGRGLAERMARERDILASLEHPHIARLYDAGVDQHGRPYLALEYVEGQPIDAYARDRSLSVRRKLSLLMQVCGAVAFAHSRLVVHRDLKPTNILVTVDGQVRLLDFGIAKLLEGDSTSETQLTQLGGRALTLDYASPEQISGEPIGTASDVYSLAVVAYELLTGVRPYRLKRGSAAELEEAIATIDPPQASTAATDDQARKQLRGDLDAILNKALKKTASHRYMTIDSFARDIELHLQRKAIFARRDSWTYRLRRLLGRHKIAAAIIATVVIALVGGAYAQVAVLIALGVGTGIALWQRKRALDALALAEAERGKAEIALDRAAAVNDFMVTLLEDVGSSEPLTGPQLLARSESLLSRDPRSAGQRAAVLTAIATLHSSYADFATARRLIDQAVASARQGGDAESLGIALAYQASFLARDGRIDEGKRALERLVVNYAEIPSVAVTVNSALSHLAQNANDANAAVRYAEAACGHMSRLPSSRQPRTAAVLVGNLAYSLVLAGRLDEASTKFAESIELFKAVGAEECPMAVSVWNNWALADLAVGNPLRALDRLNRVCDISARRSPSGNPPIYAVLNRARVLGILDRAVEALSESERALALARASGSAAGVLHSTVSRIDALRRQGRHEEALAGLLEVDDRLTVGVSPDFPAMINLSRLRVIFDANAGRLAEALEGATEIIERVTRLGLRGGQMASAYTARADVHLQLRSPAAALADVERALQIARTAQSTLPFSADVGLALLHRAEAHLQTRNLSSAAADAESALVQLTPTLGESHPESRRAFEIRTGLLGDAAR